LIVKLTPFEIEAMRGAVGASAVVLHVTESRVPAEAVGEILMLEFVVTAVVEMTQVAPEAATSQENAPDGAAEQATRLGLAAVPAAEQFVFV
jgi:hypothetical protein